MIIKRGFVLRGSCFCEEYSEHFLLFLLELRPCNWGSITIILLTKTTAAQNEVALRYYTVRMLNFLAVVFAMNI